MGAVGGAVALAIVGFGRGGWVIGGTADDMAKDHAGAAVVTALAPICAAQLQWPSGVDGRLSELNEFGPFQRTVYI